MGYGSGRFQELIYQRYGNPLEFLNNSIKRKGFDKAVNTILSQYDEDKSWSLYLSLVANPFSDVSKMSFYEFLHQDNEQQEKSQNEIGMTKEQMQMQVQFAENMLNNFNPFEGGE